MFIPDTISSNILAVYHREKQKNTNRQLKSEDLTNCGVKKVKTLRKLCLDTIVTLWEDIKIINEFVLDEDARYVLDNLQPDLPFKLAIEHIHDDLYWRRAFRTRWAGKILPTKPVKMDYEIPNQFKRSKRKNTTKNKQNIVKINTWKCFYVERHLQDILEHLKPENYNSEEMKELIELSRDYIIRLKLNQLQAPSDNNTERIPLQAILPALNNMKQLNICFKQTYVGDDFSWHILQTTPRDIENLGKGLEKCDLEVLRIINTDITCDKVTMLACHLSTNKNLRVLDFSHCKIADKGIVALCKLLQELPNLAELNLMNNFIESKGLEYLCYTLSKPDIKLKQLHLNLNNFGASGANFLARILVENTQLVQLNLSACGLTTDNVALLIKALRTNSTLLHLDLSNNSLNENIGDLFIKLLNSSNFTLQSLDLRMTLIPSETMLMIDEILNHPKRKSSYKYNKGIYKNFKDSSQLSDVNEDKNTTDVDDITTESIEFNNERDNNTFPPFHNVEDMENQVENVFRVYLDTLKKELNYCCDEYYDEHEDSARNDAKQEELIEKSYQENSNSNGDHI